MSSPPTSLSDPIAYLALLKFHRLLPRCPRTNLPVSYADLGDPGGVVVVYLLPSGCSRWVAAPMDPVAIKYGIRLIVVDRPGTGGTGQVPLNERIARSCEMVVSVLEHLDVKPAHMLATSAGIYYALHLLINHPSTFQTSLNPPPKLWLIAPWVPLLPSDDPDYWPFKWDWIPTPLIATQHITTPHLIKAAEQAQKVYNQGAKAYDTGKAFALRWYKSYFDPPASSSSSSSSLNQGSGVSSPVPSRSSKGYAAEGKGGEQDLGGDTQKLLNGIRGAGMGEGTEVRAPDPTEEGEGEGEEHDYDSGEWPPRERFWGKTPCCITCTISGYMQAENAQGIGQEHLICLNRGLQNTGAPYLLTALSDLAATIEFAQSPVESEARTRLGKKFGMSVGERLRDSETGGGGGGGVKWPLEVNVWWGWLDDMVPRKGQLWFNDLVGQYGDAIKLSIHDVPGGDHADLLARQEGIHQCFQLIQFQGNSTAPTLEV
ncbi:hypothetical protein L198_06132 [Cryptococcus wingfieldii CBS 7118]|uniref:AB hydrolase-1 domain-containing protein n=1 Tax=Cryptococcus wingfieldii CBS 7118 TaxID=1295528 RepID=A0A1E3IQU8_9TREE|nr:hypothetical protein L198_06132 [Cryptococcus wingfieldii CBS 7118]ODN90815.1 hypothetical protein L198_06132 [Cryptococcus wingfieldii CBS 7118]